MSKKVNFNQKKNQVAIRNLKIALALFVAFIVVRGLIDAIKTIKTTNEVPEIVAELKYDVNDYNSLESLLLSHNCKVISKEETTSLLKVEVSFAVPLYEKDKSNEQYFNNICKLVAEFINYKNFELIDNEKNIKIEVKCEENYITQLKINGDINYYLNHDSEIHNKKETTPTTTFTIEAKELQQAIEGNWNEFLVDWGTKESTCNGYHIFFDEGIKYKCINRSVYNIIFTQKYDRSVVNGLHVGATPEQVIRALGEPAFLEEDYVYGYVSENNYVFFDFVNNEISVYPVIKVSDEDMEELEKLISQMNKDSNVKSFVTELTNLWLDYDVYDYDSYFVDLRYTLKGFQLSISSNSLKNGVFVYQNFSGDREITNLENVYMQEKDFVLMAEYDRIMEEDLNHGFEGEEQEKPAEIGEKFAVYYKDSFRNTGPQFYSIDGEYPDSELDKTLEMSSFIWYDADNFVYSEDDEGIYIYNATTRENRKLKEIEGKIKINAIQDGVIIYNNNESINVE